MKDFEFSREILFEVHTVGNDFLIIFFTIENRKTITVSKSTKIVENSLEYEMLKG